MKMPIKEPDNINWFVAFLLLMMTLIGSLASYAYQLINGHKFNILVLLAQIIVSIFSGSIMFLIASALSWDFEWAGGLCGLAGWSGAAFIKALEERLLKKARGHDV